MTVLTRAREVVQTDGRGCSSARETASTHGLACGKQRRDDRWTRALHRTASLLTCSAELPKVQSRRSKVGACAQQLGIPAGPFLRLPSR